MGTEENVWPVCQRNQGKKRFRIIMDMDMEKRS